MQDKVNLMQNLENELIDAIQKNDKDKELMLIKQLVLNAKNIQDLAKLRTTLLANFKYPHEYWEFPKQLNADLDKILSEDHK